MKTADDVLSFEDLILHNDFLVGDQLEDHKDETERFIHTFLEWDLYEKYIYHLGWSLEYTSTSQGISKPVVMNTRVDTLQEAELIAMKKVSRFLGTQIHLEPIDVSADNLYRAIDSHDDNFYSIIDEAGAYRGMVEIQYTG